MALLGCLRCVGVTFIFLGRGGSVGGAALDGGVAFFFVHYARTDFYLIE